MRDLARPTQAEIAEPLRIISRSLQLTPPERRWHTVFAMLTVAIGWLITHHGRRKSAEVVYGIADDLVANAHKAKELPPVSSYFQRNEITPTHALLGLIVICGTIIVVAFGIARTFH